MPRPTVRVATAHLAPTLLDPAATTATILDTIAQASSQQASLIAFPESFLPGFPIWSALLPPTHHSTHTFFTRFAEASVYADGPELQAIRAAAKKHRISVSLGFSEKARYSSGTLWNSNIIIDSAGEVRVHHRKLVPTFYERLSWGAGDGKGLETVAIDVVDAAKDAQIGTATSHEPSAASAPTDRVNIGALICGENTNPLARYAMMAQGQDIHISSWPAVWPTRMPVATANDDTGNATGKNYDNVLANRLRAAAHCFEAKCFGIMSAAHLSEANIATLTALLPPDDEATKKTFDHALRHTSRAASMVLDPTGSPVPAWVVDAQGRREEREMLREEEAVLFADLNLDAGVEGKQFHDLVGGYQRFDVFELKVDRTRREPVVFGGLGGGPVG
ncbi:uncharacterized protein HMPREF1541_00656 [Cyphellophora europaea CBS 101466]|uniref:CN hydrolase domain-containing protein n=1 Tax=Cyphellophora europaea (strain CBS 101466) TaxID=1220924 RepID=W2SCM8_CYPE1|nr:uncharacterized protein HMPREF1541_00656 [Cyphellophora europaea CBS 101466]ETN46471.1 hypothetical protein HMPREF1541_00656 [Cyphellophora europaea CBS 101466]